MHGQFALTYHHLKKQRDRKKGVDRDTVRQEDRGRNRRRSEWPLWQDAGVFVMLTH